MKRIVMTMAACVLMGSVAMAQENKKDGRRPEKKLDKTEMVKHRTDQMVAKYGLDEQQAAKLLALNIQYADKMEPGPRGGHHGPHHGRPGMGQRRDSVDGQTGATPPAKGKRPELTEEQKAKMEAEHKERAAAMEAYDAELQKIMTDEQYTQFKADRKKHRQHGQRPPRRDGKDSK